MSDDPDTRLTDLEVRYSYLEHLVGELDELVRQQAEEIEGLKQAMRRLHGQIAAMSDEELPHEPPPHY